ncbi:MAG: hypothetical protein H6713_31560 [Myxococcales bacterium]|nr:hypothetical protein [Myxococcales bacterium]
MGRASLCPLALALALAGCADERESPDLPVQEAPEVFGLHAVWFAGSGDEDRELLDRFLECLIEGSTLNHYWEGEAQVELRGSYALPPPGRLLDWDELASEWLERHVGTDAGLPTPRPGETPLYLVFGGHPDLWVGACGRNSVATVAGRVAGVGVVRTTPECWPTGDRLRSETQIAAHEIVETVDRALGHGTCAGGGTCRGRAICEGYCDTFVGLECPGAPTGSFVGCEGRQVDGWVIQRFGYDGRDPDRCETCIECDFTPELCPTEDPACAYPAW